GPRAELLERELALPLLEARDTAAPLRLRARRRELLPDHAQRQELVPLEPQDRLQPLDVLLAEEAVATLRAPRRQEALVLEVADLRDRDVRKVGFQAPADGADREQAWLRNRFGGDGHRERKISLYLPIWSSS